MTDLIPVEALLALPPVALVAEGPMASQELSDRYGFQPTEFYVWDYDRRVVEQWERAGECNGCGDCCTATIAIRTTPAEPSTEAHPVMGRWSGISTDGQGVWGAAVAGERAYFAKMDVLGPPDAKRCQQLLEGNRCAIQALKPTLCKVWPFMPQQVAAYPHCSYTFKRVRTWRLHATWTVGDEVPEIELVEAVPGPEIVEHGG